MEFRYKREMNHNYLIITGVMDGFQGYQMKMLLNNQIEGILKFRVKLTDLMSEYYYEISSKQPLSRLLENRSISGEEIKKMLLSIAGTLKRAEAYLLEECQILLQPDYIYINPESFQAYLCCVPGHHGDFPSELRSLLQYLLGKINHQDRYGVVLAYGLYQESLKDNYEMEDLLKMLYEGQQGQSAEPENTVNKIKEFNGSSAEKKEFTNYSAKLEPYGNRKPDNQAVDQWRNLLMGSILFLMTFVLLLPVFIWFTKGEYSVKNNIFIFIGLDLVGAVAGGYVLSKLWSPKKVMDYKLADGQPEEDLTEDTEEVQWLDLSKPNYSDIEKTSKLFASENGDQTSLLSVAFRTLKSLNQQVDEDIVITHYPFTIGKSKEMADYAISYAAVSRLHLRVNKVSEGYTITDLNSTNGTKVGTYQLEANETIVLLEGDEISVAGINFLFS